MLVWGSRQSCFINFQWRLGRALHRPSSPTCIQGRMYSFQAWDGNKNYKTLPLQRWAETLSLHKQSLFVGCGWGVDQNWFCNHRAVIPSLAELALCIPSVPPFLFLQQQLLLQILAPKAQSKHTTTNWREIIPPKSSVSGQCSEEGRVCQTWFLISVRTGNYRLTINITYMFSVKEMWCYSRSQGIL